MHIRINYHYFEKKSRNKWTNGTNSATNSNRIGKY